MTIVVNPHNQQEELELLAFLKSRKYEYSREEDDISLSTEQKQEILERDKQFENGETETYSLEEIVAHFNIKE